MYQNYKQNEMLDIPLQLSLVTFDLNGKLESTVLGAIGVDREIDDFWPLRLELLPVR